MGSSESSRQDIKISDYEKIKIPKEYVLIKLGSYNVNLHNTMNTDNKIKEIISYMTSNFKHKTLDIICLQGFHDNVSLSNLVREFKKYCSKNKIKTYYAPSFDNIETNGSSSNSLIVTSKKMLELSIHGTKTSSSHGNNKMKKIMQNVIISKYPILSTIFGELDDKTDMDDILGIQTVIGANILIGNQIISVYNTCLSKDIKTANIVNINNAQVRMTELNELMNIINKNKVNIKHDKCSKYDLSDIHLVTGTFGINEFGNGENNQEYMDLIRDRKCIDIFRYLNETDFGYTSSSSERINYILMNLTDDLYDKKTEVYKNFKSVKTINEMLDLLFKRYQIHFLGNYVINMDSSMYYPLECVFMIKN